MEIFQFLSALRGEGVGGGVEIVIVGNLIFPKNFSSNLVSSVISAPLLFRLSVFEKLTLLTRAL